MNRRVRTVALHEYVTNVRRKEFILMTLGLPVFMLVIGVVSALGTSAALGVFKAPRPRNIGLIDPGHVITTKGLLEAAEQDIRVRIYTDQASGERDVKSGKLVGLLVLDPEYLENGRVKLYKKSGGLLGDQQPLPTSGLLTRALLAGAGADQRIVRRAVEPTGPNGESIFVLDKDKGFVPLQLGKELARFAVPYAFTILLTTSIFIAANYLLRGISDEKENRVIEVILSSVTAEELLKGKLIGLAGVGLTQVGVWVTMAGIPALLMYAAFVHMSIAALAGVILFFVLGFGLYATLMAGLGALGTSYRESQQMAGMVSIMAFCPFFVLPALLTFPNGTLARVFSFIPFTAPGTMVLRISAAEVPLWDVAISALSIAVTMWLLLKLSAKLFRFGLLAYGKRPSFQETWKWLRQA